MEFSNDFIHSIFTERLRNKRSALSCVNSLFYCRSKSLSLLTGKQDGALRFSKIGSLHFYNEHGYTKISFVDIAQCQKTGTHFCRHS